MDHTCRAVFILEEDHSIPAGHKPLMLEAILHRPIMERAVVQCLADGVQRFFVVCSPRFAEEAAACFPEGTNVVISEQHAELLDFLDNDEDTLVLCRAALPMGSGRPRLCLFRPRTGTAGGLEGQDDQRCIRPLRWCPAGCRSSDRRPSLNWNRFWRRWNKNRNFEILNI